MSKSQQQQSPRQNIMQTMLLVVTVFLGFQLLRGGLNPPKDTENKTIDQQFTELKDLNKQIKDVTIAQRLGAYENAVNQDKSLSPEQKRKSVLEAQVLVADTQLKAGLQRNDLNRLQAAYNTLQGPNKNLQGDPLYTSTAFNSITNVTGRKEFGWSSWTGQQLYEKVRTELSTRYQEQPVWGFFPGFQFIDLLVHITGAVPAFSYWFAALLLALAVRGVVWPLVQKQLMWSRQMSQLTPLTNELKEKYKNNPTELNAKIMELYQEYGINPMAGCLPVVLQMPLFFLVYQCMLHYRFEFQKGTFLWVNEGMSKATHGFIAPNLGQQDYILIVLYGISMIVTAMLTPVSDPANAKQQRIMGISMSAFFAVAMFFYALPSAFVLYWLFVNIFATAQSLRAYRMPTPPLVKVNTKAGGVFPTGTPAGVANGKLNGQVKTGTPAKHKPKKRK